MSYTALVETETYHTADEIERLVRAFEDCTLPESGFNHCAHLTVALWYLYHHCGREAAVRIREGLKRFIAAKGGPSTPMGGYHETITMFWMFVIGKFLLLADTGLSLVELANGVVERYSDKGLLFEYYSLERIFSMEARAGWVEPDLRPLG
ncbi:MAG TPA: hypothetical protein VNO14_14825 [Blastocatellia bacterium]|nr:hypothetical protein [Blastocatellia bacterium]